MITLCTLKKDNASATGYVNKTCALAERWSSLAKQLMMMNSSHTYSRASSMNELLWFLTWSHRCWQGVPDLINFEQQMRSFNMEEVRTLPICQVGGTTLCGDLVGTDPWKNGRSNGIFSSGGAIRSKRSSPWTLHQTGINPTFHVVPLYVSLHVSEDHLVWAKS